jgi:hypothetical protein
VSFSKGKGPQSSLRRLALRDRQPGTICKGRVDFCGTCLEEHQKFALITSMPGILGVVQLESQTVLTGTWALPGLTRP